MTDFVGHGTFVTGLIAALDGNGLGGKGVAGTTKVIAVRASTNGSFQLSDLIRGIEFSIRATPDVHQHEPRRTRASTQSHARALEAAFFNDVLPVAASGNNAENGNPIEFPAAAVGGRQGRPRDRPVGGRDEAGRQRRLVLEPQRLREHRGTGRERELLRLRRLLHAPDEHHARRGTRAAARGCSRVGRRAQYAYGEGTSFAAPIVSGLAALAWQVESRLASEQVADVLVRSADGGGWNEFTGLRDRRRDAPPSRSRAPTTC